MLNGFFEQNLQVKNRMSELHDWILLIQISLGTKFQLKLTILSFLDEISPKRVFLVKNEKSKHHHWTLHIQISLGIKL